MKIRHLDQQITTHFDTHKEVLILVGPRQVGKTTIVKRLFPEAQYLNVDLDPVKNTLDTYDTAPYRRILQPNVKTIIIDEVQRLKDPGRAIKIIYDQMPEYQLVVTGSSAFNIKNKTSESLAGRKITYQLFPLTLSEFLTQQDLEPDLSYSPFTQIIENKLPQDIIKIYDHRAVLDQIMLYGLYPAVLNTALDSKYLYEMIDSIIFKDLDEFSLLENKSAAIALLKLLAHQIGSLVNYNELSNRLGIDAKTVKRYIELFEQSYIIFTLKPYSTKKRDEIGKMPKVYFYDLGLRNALIENFQDIKLRNDSGALFENFVISELYKYNSYGNFGYHFNFWRTKSGSEVDLILNKTNEELIAIEIKSRSGRLNQAFKNRYPKSSSRIITKDNFWI
jgi:uncharacterized protein